MRFYPRFHILGGSFVAAALIIAASAETLQPLRPRQQTRRSRWPGTARIGALAAVLVRGAIVPAFDRCARWAGKRRMGLVARLPLPDPLSAVVGFLALDYTMYLWHRALHGVNALLRFHAVHHADADLDASTALRFPVGELAASLPLRCAQVSILG